MIIIVNIFIVDSWGDFLILLILLLFYYVHLYTVSHRLTYYHIKSVNE